MLAWNLLYLERYSSRLTASLIEPNRLRQKANEPCC
jgi:hypothetical protein